MKTIIILFILTGISISAFASEPVPTDAEVCNALLSKAAGEILSGRILSTDKTVRLRFSGGLPLSSNARTTLDALMTGSGFSISGSYDTADFVFDIAVTDISIVLMKKKSRFDRTVSLTIHMKCLDPGSSVIFAAGATVKADDAVPRNHENQTDDSHLFSSDAVRTVTGKNHTKTMAATLLFISCILAYFASQ